MNADSTKDQVHLAVGVPPMLRLHGDLMPIKFRDVGSWELVPQPWLQQSAFSPWLAPLPKTEARPIPVRQIRHWTHRTLIPLGPPPRIPRV